MPKLPRIDTTPEDIAERATAIREAYDGLTPGDRVARRERHHMHCPKCGFDLDEVVFRSVKLDKCFACGGVWLDDGELEQLSGKPGWFEALVYFLSGKGRG